MKNLEKITKLGLAGLVLATSATAGITNKLEQSYTTNDTHQSRLWTIAKSETQPVTYVGFNQIEDLDKNTYFGKQRLEFGEDLKAVVVGSTTKDGLVDTQYGLQIPLPEVFGANYGSIRATANADTHTVDVFGNWNIPGIDGLTIEAFHSIKPDTHYTEVQLEKQLPEDMSAFVRLEKAKSVDATYVIGLSKRF